MKSKNKIKNNRDKKVIHHLTLKPGAYNWLLTRAFQGF